MSTLPDGTAVNSQTVEGWNITYIEGGSTQTVEGWNINPPPVAGLSISPYPQEIESGGNLTVAGNVTKDGQAAGDVPVNLTASGPESIDTPDPLTDANGDYSQELGPFETPGDYQITAEVNGIQEQTSEGWEA